LFTSGGNCSKVQQAKLKMQMAQLDKQNLIDQLTIQEKQMRFNLTNAFDSYQIQKRNIDVSKRVFKNISRKYEQGVASSLDLTSANNNLLTAQGNYVSAVLQVLNAEAELQNLLGKK
jgi:outer membrane protein